MSNTYNGWSNWATWNAVLWTENEEHVYRARLSRHRWDEWTGDEVATFFQEVFPKGTPDMNGVIPNDINWDEISETWNNEDNNA